MLAEEVRGAAKRPRPITVLLVDDHEDYLAAATEFLLRHPRVRIIGQARGGAEAVRLARELAPDLVLMDATMPEMNGFDATRAIKARRGAPKVVMVTFHANPTYRNAAEEAGADAFVTKSQFVGQFLSLLQKLFPVS